MGYREVKQSAQGRWPSILRQLGVPERVLNGRNQPCPSCGGRDRFRFTNWKDNGNFFCNTCGSGNGFGLLCLVNGWDFDTSLEQVAAVVGKASYTPNRPLKHQRRIEMLNELWRESRTSRRDDPVGIYLERRCGITEIPRVLRTHSRLPYIDDEKSFHPGMVAMVQSADGVCQTLHRTFLTHDGQKADLPSPRRLMPGGYAEGSAVQLYEPGRVLGVAEGIETSIAAHQLFEVPVWAAINAHNLSNFVVPDGVEELMIFGDADPKYAGQAAAYRLAQKWAVKGLSVSVHIPNAIGTDWYDVWEEEHRLRQDDSHS